MNTLPKMRTQEDAIKEQAEQIKNGGERGFMLALLSNMTGSATRGLPVTDDHDKLAQDAIRDFRRSDYTEAASTVESLVLIVDHYKNLAEEYLSALTDHALSTNEYGQVTNYSFVLIEGGEQMLGYAEVIRVEDQTDHLDSLWSEYVKDYLPFAGETEKKYITRKFAAQIEEDSK